MLRSIIAFTTLLTAFTFISSAQAATGKYLVVGTNVRPASNGQIFALNGSGTAVVGAGFALPTGPPNSSFPVYNSGNGLLMYSGSRPGTVGNFNLETWIDTASVTVATHAYPLGGLFDSEWEADPASGNFLSAVRGGPSTVVTYNPVAGTFTSGATHVEGIPESTWIYNGDVWFTGESTAFRSTPLLGGGLTAGASALEFSGSTAPLSIPGLPASEFVTVATFADGISLYANHSSTLRIFDLDTAPTVAPTTVDLLSFLNVTGGYNNAYVTGVELDPVTNLFYVVGAIRIGGDGGTDRDFLAAVSKTGVVTPLLQENSGDTIVTGTNFGLAFADFGGDSGGAVPEPSTYVLALLGFVGLGMIAWRKRRRA